MCVNAGKAIDDEEEEGRPMTTNLCNIRKLSWEETQLSILVSVSVCPHEGEEGRVMRMEKMEGAYKSACLVTVLLPRSVNIYLVAQKEETRKMYRGQMNSLKHS